LKCFFTIRFDSQNINRNKMSIEIELRDKLSFIPEDLLQQILYGYLNNNLLDIVISKPLIVLQNAVIIENSTRRINDRRIFMSLSKSELIRFILLKTGGLKNMRWYIKLAEKNLVKIQQLLSIFTNDGCRHVFNLNNGLTHKYYSIINIPTEIYLHCTEIHSYKSYIDRIEINAFNEMKETVRINISELETAIYVSGDSEIDL